MLFWILLFLPIGLALAGCVALFLRENNWAAVFFTAALLCGILCWMGAGTVWFDQSKDIGTIKGQSLVIAVYQEQVTELTAETQAYHYQPDSLLNGDSPVASIVKALTDAQAALTAAKAVRAEAMVCIEQRRSGPMSGVITLVGDYK